MSATSSAAMNRRFGVAEHASTLVYIANEGWVKWTEIEKQVAQAHARWRMKKAVAGIIIADGAELREVDIRLALQSK